MIINNPPKISALLFSFQKKKLYYNRISEAQIYLRYRIIAYVFLWAQLTIQQNWKPIKRSFLMLLIVLTLLSIVRNQTDPSILGSYFIPIPEIQHEKQAKYLTHPKRSTTSFYQYKSQRAKNYINSQQEVYRSIIYSKNQEKINRNNQKLDRKFNMALNRFADLTPLEFSETFTNLYKSNKRIKIYAKKLIDRQKSYDPSNTYPIDETDFIRTNQDDFVAVRDHVLKHMNDKKTNVSEDNFDFRMVEEVFGNSNPSVEFREDKQKQLKNYFDWNTVPKFKSQSSGFDIDNSTLSNNDMFASLQRQIKTIMQNTASTLPLKLTSNGDSVLTGTRMDSGLSSGSGSIPTSSSGDFSSSVIDWTVHAGKIRYQGVCGACYTFATSDVVGSLYAIYKFGFFVMLSTQQVIDCSTNGLTYGCNGGFLEGSYAYMQIKGIQTDTNYPYTSAISGVSNTCKKDGGSFKVASFRNIQEGNCRALVNQLNYGPVSIGIAGYRLQFYSDGIFNDCNSYVDHAVVLIAYKARVGWKIKNSWGADWGMGGFAWIADGNNCGICNMAVSARI